MLVDCPDCGRSYHLGADDIGERGRVVICPRCDARWFQKGDRAVDVIAPRVDAWSSDGRSVGAHRSGRSISRPAPPRASAALRGALAVGMLGLAAACAFAGVARRDAVVKAMPRAARMYATVGLHVNVRGLDFAHVTSRPTASDDLTIGGEIRNVAGRRVRMPRVAFEIRDASGATLMSWSESPPAASLAGGKTITFESLPHHVPPESRTVLVRFEGGDAAPARVASAN